MNIISPEQWNDNLFKRIGQDWMLITAGSKESCNTMTASYGGFGILFSKTVAHIYVRPHRHTYTFLEGADGFSLSFFNGEKYRKELQYCGRISGKDEDKLAHCGFTVSDIDGIPCIDQASITVLCKKIYAADIDSGIFYDKDILSKCYPDGDTHRMYVGEILKIIEK